MSYLSLAGSELMRATIRLPLVGTWVADVEHMDTPTVAAGEQVTLVLGAQSWVGTVLRVETSQGRTSDVRIVGGAGGLATALGPQQYRSPPASLVFRDALVEAGESADPTTLVRLSSTLLRGWVRRGYTLGQELDALSRLLGYRWRVLPSGAIWMGEDDGAAVSIEDAVVVEDDAAAGRAVVAANEPTVMPGQTWTHPVTGGSWEVGAVIHHVDERDTRTEILRASSGGRLGEMLDLVARRAAPPDLHADYEYVVVAQNGDGTFELKATDTGDASAHGLPGLSRVPYYPTTPGQSMTMPAMSRCLVRFKSGSPQDPFIAGWITGTPTTLAFPVTSLLHLGAATGADFLPLDSPLQANLTAIAASISNIAAAVNTLAPGSVTVIYGSTSPITPTAAARLKGT